MTNSKLKKRFIQILALYTILVLVFWFIYHKTVFSYIQKSTEENITLTENNLLRSLDNEFSRMKLTSSSIALSASVQSFLSETDIAEYYAKAQAASEIIHKIAYQYGNTNQIITVSKDGAIFRFNGNISNASVKEIYKDIQDDRLPLYAVVEVDGSSYFAHASPVYGQKGTHPVGHIIMLVGTEKARRVLTPPEMSTGMDTAILLNDAILLSSNENLDGKNIRELDNIYGTVTVSPVTGSNLYAAVAVSAEVTQYGERLFILVSVSLFLLLILALAFLYRLLSVKMITPMLSYAEQMQMGLLSTQMDAHFVVNTLVGIEMLSSEAENKKAAEMAGNLVAMLQHLHASENEVNVYAEVENVIRYIDIMNIRKNNKYTITENLSDILIEYRMPGQILQPIVENALFHGMGNQTGECILTISGELENNALLIHVADNGKGIPSSTLKELKQCLNKADEQDLPKKGLSGVALVNIQKRIWTRYGKSYGIIIESEEGKGTTVTVRLPVIED